MLPQHQVIAAAAVNVSALAQPSTRVTRLGLTSLLQKPVPSHGQTNVELSEFEDGVSRLQNKKPLDKKSTTRVLSSPSKPSEANREPIHHKGVPAKAGKASTVLSKLIQITPYRKTQSDSRDQSQIKMLPKLTNPLEACKC